MGFGHAVRCLALADAFGAGGEWDVAFAMADDETGAAVVRQRGFPVEMNTGAAYDPAREARWLAALADRDAAVLVLDIRTALPLEAVRAMRARGMVIVAIDDPGERRLAADLVFYPPVQQVARLDWTGFTGQLFVGWEWIPLRAEVAYERARRSAAWPRADSAPVVLVTMGGSDPAGFTMLAVSALELVDEEVRVRIALGPGYAAAAELDRRLRHARHPAEVLRNVPAFLHEAAKTDLAVASFGVTAYELAALGVPSLHVCRTADHSESASGLARAGASVNLGVYDGVDPRVLADAVAALVRDPGSRLAMSARGMAVLDGLGASRIATVVNQHVRGAHAFAN